jgi:hypothetical protein
VLEGSIKVAAVSRQVGRGEAIDTQASSPELPLAGGPCGT